MKQLIEWFFGTALGLNSRGKYRNLADNGEPDEVVFRALTETFLAKKIDEANYQSQATAAEITSYLNGDKYTIPANLPVVTLGGGSILTLGETAAIAGTPRRTYTLDAPLPSTQNIIDRVATKFTTPANLPIVIADSAPGNAATVSSTTIGGVTTYQVFSAGVTSNVYIPLAGTDVGVPVTGDIQFQGGERLYSEPTGPLGIVGENFIFNGVVHFNKLRTYQIGTGSYSSPQFSALFTQGQTDTTIQAYDSGIFSTIQVSPPFINSTVSNGSLYGLISINAGSVILRSDVGTGLNELSWDANQLGLKALGSLFYGYIKSDFITAAHEHFQLPNKGGLGGTFAMLDDIVAVVGGDYQNTFFVDPDGDAIGLKGDPLTPYNTIKAAVTAAVAGDLIIVLPGLYDEYDLARDGVNYYFYPGAIVQPTFNGGEIAIFTDQTLGGPVNYNIYGQGEFLCNGHSGNDTSALVSSYTGGSINIEAKTIASLEAWGQIGATIRVKNATITVEAHCYSGGVVVFDNCTFIDVVLLGNYYGDNCSFTARNCRMIRNNYNTIYSTYIPGYDQTLDKHTLRFHGSDAVHVGIKMELIDCYIENTLGGDCLFTLDADFDATSGLRVKDCRFYNSDPSKASIRYTDVMPSIINNTAFDAHNLKFYLAGNTSNVPTIYEDTDFDFPAGIINQYALTGFLVEGDNAIVTGPAVDIYSRAGTVNIDSNSGDININANGVQYINIESEGLYYSTHSGGGPQVYIDDSSGIGLETNNLGQDINLITSASDIILSSNDEIVINSGTLFQVSNAFGGPFLEYDSTNGLIITDNLGNGGAKYAGNYHLDYTDRSLVDKEFVVPFKNNNIWVDNTQSGYFQISTDSGSTDTPFIYMDNTVVQLGQGNLGGGGSLTVEANNDIQIINIVPGKGIDLFGYSYVNLRSETRLYNFMTSPFHTATFDFSNLNTSNRTLTVPNVNGTIQVGDPNMFKLNAMELSTGLYSWTAPGILVTGASTFDISAAEGFIHNTTSPLSPTTTQVIYAGATGLTTPFLGTHPATYFLLNTSSVLVMQNTYPTMVERRSMIFLGVIAHPMGALTGAGPSPDVCINAASQLRAMFKGIRFVNDGVTLYNNSTNLTLANTSGTLYGFGIGFIVNGNTGPDFIDIAVGVPTTFQYRTQTGIVEADTTLISPTFYDVAGTKTLNPGGGGTATNQRFYLLQNGVIRAQYGQTVYNNLTDAVAAASTEPFIVAANTRLGTLIGILSVTKNCTDLSNTTTAKFINVSKFGELVGVAGSSSVSTFQNVYNNGGAANPKLLTSIPNGSVSFRSGAAANTASVFEIQNIGGASTTFSISGDGKVIIGSNALVSGGDILAGKIEFLTDDLYHTGTTGTKRKVIRDYAYLAIVGALTLTGEHEFVDCTTGTFAVTLPTAVGYNKQYTIYNSGTGVITLNTTGGQTISGIASGVLSLIQHDTIMVRSNGTNWYKIN